MTRANGHAHGHRDVPGSAPREQPHRDGDGHRARRGHDLRSRAVACGRSSRDVICIETPQTYAGTFSGTYTNAFNDYKVTWTGDAIIELQSEHGSPPTGRTGAARLRGSTPSRAARCTRRSPARASRGRRAPFAARPTFSLPTGLHEPDPSPSRRTSTGRGSRFGIGTSGTEQIPYTETGALTATGQNPQYPLAGLHR